MADIKLNQRQRRTLVKLWRGDIDGKDVPAQTGNALSSRDLAYCIDDTREYVLTTLGADCARVLNSRENSAPGDTVAVGTRARGRVRVVLR